MKKLIEKFIELLKRIIFKYYFKHIFSFEKVRVYELKHKISLSAVFMFCGLSDKKLDDITMTQTQILTFCEKFRDQISGNNHSSLLYLGDEYFIANVYRKEEELCINVSRASKSCAHEQGQRVIVVD